MSERRRPEPGLDLADVLLELGHTPESFARAVGRNASGLRRAIRGESMMTHRTAIAIADGLVAEGWEGDPHRIRQLDESLPPGPYRASRRAREVAGLSSVSGAELQLYKALGNLMRYFGREEVERVYKITFGTKPDETNK